MNPHPSKNLQSFADNVRKIIFRASTQDQAVFPPGSYSLKTILFTVEKKGQGLYKTLKNVVTLRTLKMEKWTNMEISTMTYRMLANRHFTITSRFLKLFDFPNDARSSTALSNKEQFEKVCRTIARNITTEIGRLRSNEKNHKKKGPCSASHYKTSMGNIGLTRRPKTAKLVTRIVQSPLKSITQESKRALNSLAARDTPFQKRHFSVVTRFIPQSTLNSYPRSLSLLQGSTDKFKTTYRKISSLCHRETQCVSSKQQTYPDLTFLKSRQAVCENASKDHSVSYRLKHLPALKENPDHPRSIGKNEGWDSKTTEITIPGVGRDTTDISIIFKVPEGKAVQNGNEVVIELSGSKDNIPHNTFDFQGKRNEAEYSAISAGGNNLISSDCNTIDSNVANFQNESVNELKNASDETNTSAIQSGNSAGNQQDTAIHNEIQEEDNRGVKVTNVLTKQPCQTPVERQDPNQLFHYKDQLDLTETNKANLYAVGTERVVGSKNNHSIVHHYGTKLTPKRKKSLVNRALSQSKVESYWSSRETTNEPLSKWGGRETSRLADSRPPWKPHWKVPVKVKQSRPVLSKLQQLFALSKSQTGRGFFFRPTSQLNKKSVQHSPAKIKNALSKHNGLKSPFPKNAFDDKARSEKNIRDVAFWVEKNLESKQKTLSEKKIGQYLISTREMTLKEGNEKLKPKRFFNQGDQKYLFHSKYSASWKSSHLPNKRLHNNLTSPDVPYILQSPTMDITLKQPRKFLPRSRGDNVIQEGPKYRLVEVPLNKSKRCPVKENAQSKIKNDFSKISSMYTREKCVEHPKKDFFKKLCQEDDICLTDSTKTPAPPMISYLDRIKSNRENMVLDDPAIESEYGDHEIASTQIQDHTSNVSDVKQAQSKVSPRHVRSTSDAADLDLLFTDDKPIFNYQKDGIGFVNSCAKKEMKMSAVELPKYAVGKMTPFEALENMSLPEKRVIPSLPISRLFKSELSPSNKKNTKPIKVVEVIPQNNRESAIITLKKKDAAVWPGVGENKRLINKVEGYFEGAEKEKGWSFQKAAHPSASVDLTSRLAAQSVDNYKKTLMLGACNIHANGRKGTKSSLALSSAINKGSRRSFTQVMATSDYGKATEFSSNNQMNREAFHRETAIKERQKLLRKPKMSPNIASHPRQSKPHKKQAQVELSSSEKLVKSTLQGPNRRWQQFDDVSTEANFKPQTMPFKMRVRVIYKRPGKKTTSSSQYDRRAIRTFLDSLTTEPDGVSNKTLNPRHIL